MNTKRWLEITWRSYYAWELRGENSKRKVTWPHWRQVRSVCSRNGRLFESKAHTDWTSWKDASRRDMDLKRMIKTEKGLDSFRATLKSVKSELHQMSVGSHDEKCKLIAFQDEKDAVDRSFKIATRTLKSNHPQLNIWLFSSKKRRLSWRKTFNQKKRESAVFMPHWPYL